MNAMILCAGLGTRLRPYTDVLAKPAIPFLNIPLLGYSLYQLEQTGLERLAINTHHLPQTVETAAREVIGFPKYQVHFSHETPEILSSGGGIWRAEKFLRDESDLLVCNGDEVLFFRERNGFQRLLRKHRESGALATLLTTDHSDVGTRLNGIRADADGRVTALSVREPGARHFAGVFAFSPRIWEFLADAHRSGGDVFHIFKDVLTPAIAQGENVMTHHEPDLLWLETSDPKSFIQSTQKALGLFVNGDEYGQEIRDIFKRYHRNYTAGANQKIWLGENCRIEADVDPEAKLLIGDHCVVGREVQIKGFAVLGRNAQFKNGVLENSVIAKDIAVHEMVALRNQLLLQ